ncbi:hypothetical protein BDV12DRAFT_198432 [Aspergillus spectabilis]
MQATEVCIEPDNYQYFLLYPKDDAEACECERITDMGPCQQVCRNNKFSKPPGLDALDGTSYGGITKEDLVKGSNDTTPGFMRIAVCSAERAFQSWDTTSKDSSPNYPCDIPPGRDNCEDSTFVDQTHDDYPSVADCRPITRNIEGDGETEWTH